MISSFVDWLVSIIESIGYVGVSLAMFIESFFAPIPSEIILPFSGFVASKGSLNVYLVTIFATISAYLGSLPFYIIGYFGDKRVRKFLEKYGKYLFISKTYCILRNVPILQSTAWGPGGRRIGPVRQQPFPR